MTSGEPKCEHESIQTIRFGKEPLEHYCAHCRVRMVPSDVLEEAARILRENEFSRCACGMDPDASECLQCSAREHWDKTKRNPHEPGCRLEALLRRIDGVLEK